ncbi:hypothetical protein [Sinorhizobium meliloti]|uniref:hypothetical protein n=1 Tax=Rhizobium meliloti TaxID=382 RepID=UPI000FDA8078|nr:hypothetical protein [Sinorhizobium meliloti]RVO68376.1 hypothetical protein CN087_12945 [Sinorhizobium meliloti]
MPTSTKSAEPAPVASRLNYLEEKVRNLTPGEAPDLAALTANVNRIFRLAFEGASVLPLEPYDPEQLLAFEEGEPGSATDGLFKSVWGQPGSARFSEIAARPLRHQLLGGGELGAYFVSARIFAC